MSTSLTVPVPPKTKAVIRSTMWADLSFIITAVLNFFLFTFCFLSMKVVMVVAQISKGKDLVSTGPVFGVTSWAAILQKLQIHFPCGILNLALPRYSSIEGFLLVLSGKPSGWEAFGGQRWRRCKCFTACQSTNQPTHQSTYQVTNSSEWQTG